MRKGWEYKKLNEVCEKGASNIVINKLTDNSGEYPLFGASGLVKNIDFFHQDKPYIGIVKDGAGVGRVNIYPAYSSLVGTMQYIFPKEGYSIDFIKYFLVKLDLSHCVSGATIPHIYFKDYGKENIPTPSLATQLAIVSELDKINELIRLKKEQLKDFDNLAQSLFYEMFGDPVENEKGWEVKKIKDIATEKLSYGSGASAVPFNKSVRYIRITDINEYGELKDEKVSPNIYDEKYLLAEGDILFARSGATVGKTYLHKQNEIPCIYAGYLIRLRPNELLVLPNYVYYYTKSNYYKSFICANQRVVAQPNINAKQYGDLDIPLPPLSLQRLFAQRIEQIEREKSEVQKSIQDLETLLASRMQYWFE